MPWRAPRAAWRSVVVSGLIVTFAAAVLVAAAVARMPGHHVLLDCDGVHVLVAHLKPGTVRARPGEWIEAGASIGLVGNSGNSNEPHLHVHAQWPAPGGHEPLSGDPLSVRFDGRYLVRNDRVTRVVGGTLALAAVMVFRQHLLARAGAFAAGAVLLGWIIVQVTIIGYVSWMQPATFAGGLLMLVLALLLRSSGEKRRRGSDERCTTPSVDDETRTHRAF